MMDHQTFDTILLIYLCVIDTVLLRHEIKPKRRVRKSRNVLSLKEYTRKSND